jgi:ABC-type sugar transport system permease subunit
MKYYNNNIENKNNNNNENNNENNNYYKQKYINIVEYYKRYENIIIFVSIILILLLIFGLYYNTKIKITGCGCDVKKGGASIMNKSKKYLYTRGVNLKETSKRFAYSTGNFFISIIMTFLMVIFICIICLPIGGLFALILISLYLLKPRISYLKSL